MTGCNSVETAILAMKAGAFDYILKPFSQNILLDKINRLFQFKEFINPENTIPAFKKLYSEFLAVSNFTINANSEENNKLINSIEKKIDYFFSAQKKCEQFILIQFEAMKKISGYAEQLKEKTPENSEQYKLVNKIILESMKSL